MRKVNLAVVALLLNSLSMPTWAGNIKKPEITTDTETLTNSIKHAVNSHLFPSKQINKNMIENIALQSFIQFRRSAENTWISSADDAYVRNGRIYFKGYKNFIAVGKTLCSTPIVIDNEGNFTVYTEGKREDGKGAEFIEYRPYKTTIYGIKRPDGFYRILISATTTDDIRDINGNKVNDADIKQHYRSSLLGELDKVQDFSDINQNMISAILAGHGVYEIDPVKEDTRYTVYADTLSGNIEIRLVKKDAKTIYGVYIVSKNESDNATETNHGSQIYAFKYSDTSTNQKQRSALMTKRVVQSEFDEENPTTPKYTTGTKGSEYEQSQTFTKGAGIFFRKKEETKTSNLDKVYEEFLCEGIVHTTYTQDNGIFYKNQQRMF